MVKGECESNRQYRLNEEVLLEEELENKQDIHLERGSKAFYEYREQN